MKRSLKKFGVQAKARRCREMREFQAMKKSVRDETESCWSLMPPRWSGNVENFKRRRALQPGPGLDFQSQLFFERILNIKKMRELVFITKSLAKGR